MAQPSRAKPLYKDEGEVEDLGTATRLLSLGVQSNGPHYKPVITPIHHSSTYYANSCEEFGKQLNSGYGYSRVRTPNTDELEMTISQIEHGNGTVVFPSGMSAIFTTLMCFLKSGDHVVAHLPLYSCSSFVLRNVLAKYDIEVTFVDLTLGVEEYRKATRSNTALYYGEIMCNPMMSYLDVEGLAQLGKENGILTVADGTFSTPINLAPLDYGIDVVLHSCTKYMGGHSDLLAGCVTVAKVEHYSKLHSWKMFSGTCMSAFDASLLMRSMRTLQIRVQRHNENGMKVAKYLEKHPKVKRVHYLGLPSHPQHQLASKTLKGFGGMMSIELFNYEDSIKFAEATRIFKLAVSLGGAESLIEHVRSMTHGKWVTTDKEKAAIPDTLLRLSVGLEDVKDQIADLEQAFNKIGDWQKTKDEINELAENQ